MRIDEPIIPSSARRQNLAIRPRGQTIRARLLFRHIAAHSADVALATCVLGPRLFAVSLGRGWRRREFRGAHVDAEKQRLGGMWDLGVVAARFAIVLILGSCRARLRGGGGYKRRRSLVGPSACAGRFTCMMYVLLQVFEPIAALLLSMSHSRVIST